MAFNIKPVLKPEGSIVAGIATVGVVYGIYQTHVGPATSVGATEANTPMVDGSVKNAGLISLVAVSGISLLARDPNIFILGMAAIVVLHSHMRVQAATNPESGMLENPGPSAYVPAQAQVSGNLQAVA